MGGNKGVRNRQIQGKEMTRPFKILGIQQIAIGAKDKSTLHKLWIDILGLTFNSNFRSEKENVDEDIATLGMGPFAVEVDLMQPIDPDKKPRVDTPPPQSCRAVG